VRGEATSPFGLNGGALRLKGLRSGVLGRLGEPKPLFGRSRARRRPGLLPLAGVGVLLVAEGRDVGGVVTARGLGSNGVGTTGTRGGVGLIIVSSWILGAGSSAGGFLSVLEYKS
jgi:hypothetical protein